MDALDAMGVDAVAGMAGIEQRSQSAAIAFGDGIGDRRQRGDHAADRERGAPFIVDRGDDAVILQLQLLLERQPHQGALLDDRKGAEDPAGRCYRE